MYDHIKYLVQWDNRSKAFPFRVVSMSGVCYAYFKTSRDAGAWCEARQS